jgi:hypothetical protein
MLKVRYSSREHRHGALKGLDPAALFLKDLLLCGYEVLVLEKGIVVPLVQFKLSRKGCRMGTFPLWGGVRCLGRTPVFRNTVKVLNCS